MGLGLRVTFGSIARHSQGAIETALERVSRAQNALTTGKRINRPSDDPGGAARVIGLKDALGDIGQYQRNIESARTFFGITDTALNETGNAVRHAREVAIQAATATNDNPVGRQALAQQIARIKEQVVGLANTTLAGRYVFAGQRTDTRPYDPADATNTFAGDSGQLRVQINRGEYVTMNTAGEPVFSTLLKDLDTLQADILAGNVAGGSATGITRMGDALDRVLSARGVLGAQMNRVEDTQSRLAAAQEEFTAFASNLEDVDISEAFMQLQTAQNAYQASLASASRSFQQSLMDYLR